LINAQSAVWRFAVWSHRLWFTKMGNRVDLLGWTAVILCLVVSVTPPIAGNEPSTPGKYTLKERRALDKVINFLSFLPMRAIRLIKIMENYSPFPAPIAGRTRIV